MGVVGCTADVGTEGRGEGPMRGRAAVPVLAGDTAETLAARVRRQEHQRYPQALLHFLTNHPPSASSADALLVA